MSHNYSGYLSEDDLNRCIHDGLHMLLMLPRKGVWLHSDKLDLTTSSWLSSVSLDVISFS